MPTIRTPDVPPDEGWQYPGITGPNIKSPDYRQLYGRVAKHYRANGQEPPTRDAVDLWVCENLTVRCDEGNATFENKFTSPTSYASRGVKGPDWPFVLRPLKLLAQPGDKGLGSIIARTIGPIGGDAYKTWYRKVFGRPCGCNDREVSLDLQYPL